MFFREGRRKLKAGASSPLYTFNPTSATREQLNALLAVCKNNLVSFDADLIKRAFQYSYSAHKPHVRKSGEPYFTHPYAVAMIVAQEIPLDDVSVVAALLHDVIEDCDGYAYENIVTEFGTTIADIVEGATKISNLLKSREVTKADNYRKLMISMVADIRVILVKFADRLHNMRTLEFVSRDKQTRIAHETLEIYAPLAHRLGLGTLKWELEDQCFKYLHPVDYRQLKDQVMLKRRDREAYISKFEKPLRAEFDKLNITYEISGRPKHLYSIYKKMVERHKTIDEIYDLFAIRVILDTEEVKSCYLAYAIVCEIYTPIPERYKNYIALPKQNGYKSIHTTVLGPDGKMVEVQIRNREMHEVAEKGIAAHWAYKEQSFNKQNSFDNWIRWVRELLEVPLSATSEEEGAKQLIDNFKLNLYQQEIYVFTPKGDLIVLPNKATPVDFAFEIHSEVGLHTIGAKVNGRIVPLNRKLRSGDQVEIITSRNQHLSPDWEQFVITQKARVALRRFVNDQTKDAIRKGREKWERKVRKVKPFPDEDAMSRVARQLNFASTSKLFVALGNDELSVDDVLKVLTSHEEVTNEQQLLVRNQGEVFEQFAHIAREEQGILIDGKQEGIQYDFARCCSPLPGDDIIGFVTQGHGIKIHRRACRNIQRLTSDETDKSIVMRERLIEISWPEKSVSTYLGGIQLEGEDRPGILNEIALTITSYNNTNIRSVNIDSQDAYFHGSVLVSVENIEHLHRLIERVKKVKGVSHVERFIEVT